MYWTRHEQRSCSGFIYTLLAISFGLACGCGANDTTAKPASATFFAQQTPDQQARFLSLEVAMTERDEEFQRQRDQFQSLPWFQRTAPVTHMTQEQLQAARRESRRGPHRGLHVELPGRLVLFNDRHIELDLRDAAIKPHLGQLGKAFPYFPELQTLSISNYEAAPRLISLLRDAHSSTHLSSIKFLDGKLSRDEVAVLAKHPSLRVLYLTSCDISLEDFAQLAKLQTLEEVWLARGSAATPECFLTLAKLPKIRSVYLDAHDAFDVPISDEVLRSIESLDGRLEEVVAQFPATIHPSLVSALLKVKSLRTFDIATVSEGLRLADAERLDNLKQLRAHFKSVLV